MQGTEKGPVLFSTCPNCCCLGGESRSFPLGSPHLLWPRSVGRSVALDPSIWSSVSGRYIPRRHNHRLLREQTGGGRGRNTKEGLFAVPRAGALATDDDDVYISWIDGAGACQRGGGLARTICPKGGGRTHREGIPAPLSAAAATVEEEGESHYITEEGKGTPEDREGGKKGKEGTSPRAR